MNHQLIKLLSCCSLLIVGHDYLYAVPVANQVSQAKKDYTFELSQSERRLLVAGYVKEYYALDVLHALIQYYLHDYPLQYKGKELPRNLAGQDLYGFDFTGCHFIHVLLKDSNLDNAILDDTTCNYEVSNQYMVDVWNYSSYARKVFGGIPKNLKSITVVYPKLQVNSQKVKLLHIASALFQLYIDLFEKNNKDKKDEYVANAYYWFFKLWMLKKEVKDHDCKAKMVSSLEKTFDRTVQHACWRSRFVTPQPNKKQGVLGDMLSYEDKFEKGLNKYTHARPYLKNRVKVSIKSLVEVYSKVLDKKQQQEVCNITCALSRSWQFSKEALLEWCFYWEKRLVVIKNQLPRPLKKKIIYDTFVLA